MATYFFHMTEGDTLILDPDGLDQPNLAAAQRAAIEGAKGLIAEAIMKGETHYQGRFDVEEEHGDKVFTLTFACPLHIEAMPPFTDQAMLQGAQPDEDRFG